MERRLSRKGSGESGGRPLGALGKKKVPETIVDAEGNVQYRCEVCRKLFNKNYNLRAHSRLHTGERPFKCTAPGCEKSFLWKSSLTSHLAAHRKESRQTMRMQSAIEEGERVAMVAPQDGTAVSEFGSQLYPIQAGEIEARRLDRSHSMPVDNYSPHFDSTELTAPSFLKSNSEVLPDHMTFSPAFAEHTANQFEGGSSNAFSPAIHSGDKRVHSQEFQRSYSSPKRLASGPTYQGNHVPRIDSGPGSQQMSRPPSHSLSATMLELEEIIKPSLQARLSPRHALRNRDPGIATTEMGAPYSWAGGSFAHEFRQSPLVSDGQHAGPAAWLDGTSSFQERRSVPWIDTRRVGVSNEGFSQVARNNYLHESLPQSMRQPCSDRMPPRLPRYQPPYNAPRRAPSLNFEGVPYVQHMLAEAEGQNMSLSPVLDPPSQNAPTSATTSSLGNALNTLESLELEQLGTTYNNDQACEPWSNMTPTFQAGIPQRQAEAKRRYPSLPSPHAPGGSLGVDGSIGARLGAVSGVATGHVLVGGGATDSGPGSGYGPGFLPAADLLIGSGDFKEIPLFSPARASPSSRDYPFR